MTCADINAGEEGPSRPPTEVLQQDFYQAQAAFRFQNPSLSIYTSLLTKCCYDHGVLRSHNPLRPQFGYSSYSCVRAVELGDTVHICRGFAARRQSLAVLHTKLFMFARFAPCKSLSYNSEYSPFFATLAVDLAIMLCMPNGSSLMSKLPCFVKWTCDFQQNCTNVTCCQYHTRFVFRDCAPACASFHRELT